LKQSFYTHAHKGAVHADMVGFIAGPIGFVGRFETCECAVV